MRRFLVLVCFLGGLSIFLAASAFSQTPSPTPLDEEKTVRITTNLVQLDVNVSGKDGKPMTGLSADDFRVFQDGREQKIVAVTYVDETSATRTPVPRRPADRQERQIAAPPTGVRSRQGRVVTFVVDDGNCLATLEGTGSIRDAVKRFIDTEMQPDDRVAIYRTAGGSSLLQAYTSNKDVLRRMANRISLIGARGCGSTFDALRDTSTIKITGSGAASFESENDKKAREDREANERRNQVVGTLGVLSFVVERLKGLPQRKAIFLMSEGIVTSIKDDSFDRLRELADKAARSSVVIHTLSAKGVSVPGFISAQDEVLPGIIGGQDNVTAAVAARAAEERALNEGLGYLAYQTGGRFVRSSNRLDIDVSRVLDAQSAYYLVAYEPDSETFKGKEFHRIEVRVSRPEVSVTSRRGFYNRADIDEQPPVFRSPDSLLFQAIASPFAAPGIDIRPTLLIGRDETGSAYVRVLFHLSGEDLALIPDGTDRKATIDVVAVILDEKGKVAAEFNRTYPIKVPAAGVASVERNGLDFSADLPVKKPGIYSFRIAVRNNGSKKLGSGGEVLDVPELKGSETRIGGLIATGFDPAGRPALPTSRPANAAFAPVLTTESPAVRRFARGSAMAYAYSLYDASFRDAGPQPQFTKQIKLYRDGSEIAAVPEAPVTGRKTDGRLDDTGVIRITNSTAPGEYVLQVIVRNKARGSVSTQWIDFEVID